MSVRRVEITEDFHRWPDRMDWLTWVQRCGLDPNNTCLPGWIECDDDARTVTALTIFKVPAPVHIDRRPLTVQLESRALPFPGPRGVELLDYL